MSQTKYDESYSRSCGGRFEVAPRSAILRASFVVTDGNNDVDVEVPEISEQAPVKTKKQGQPDVGTESEKSRNSPDPSKMQWMSATSFNLAQVNHDVHSIKRQRSNSFDSGPLGSTFFNSVAAAGQEPNEIGKEGNAMSGCRRFTKRLTGVYKKNEVFILVILAILLARAYPPLGAKYLLPHITSTWIAVVFIFLLAGISLKTEEFSKAFQQFKFNLFVQTFSFGGISSFVFGLTRILLNYGAIDKGLADGMVVCSCLPMTISSTSVFTKMSGGDEAAAIFNSAFGNMIAVLLSPGLILAYLGVTGLGLNVSEVFYKLALRVVAPVLVGQVLQKVSKGTVRFIKHHHVKFQKGQLYAVIWIVYTVFCRTFSTSNEIRVIDVVKMILLQFLIFVTYMTFAWYCMKILFRKHPQLMVMGLFGCTHKTVAMGVPMIGAIYEGNPLVGLYTLPLLVWYPLQLIVGSFICPQLREFTERETRRQQEADGMQKDEGHTTGEVSSSGNTSVPGGEPKEIDDDVELGTSGKQSLPVATTSSNNVTQMEDGDYTEGDYTEGDYTEGDYTEGDYTEGDYTEGDYTEGDYSEEMLKGDAGSNGDDDSMDESVKILPLRRSISWDGKVADVDEGVVIVHGPDRDSDGAAIPIPPSMHIGEGDFSHCVEVEKFDEALMRINQCNEGNRRKARSLDGDSFDGTASWVSGKSQDSGNSEKSNRTSKTSATDKKKKKKKKKSRSRKTCSNDHSFLQEGIVYEKIETPGHPNIQSSFCAGECCGPIAPKKGVFGVLPSTKTPVYVCMRCKKHVVCHFCWKDAKRPNIAGSLWQNLYS